MSFVLADEGAASLSTKFAAYQIDRTNIIYRALSPPCSFALSVGQRWKIEADVENGARHDATLLPATPSSFVALLSLIFFIRAVVCEPLGVMETWVSLRRAFSFLFISTLTVRLTVPGKLSNLYSFLWNCWIRSLESPY